LAGERITYTLVAVNHGPSDAAGVVVTDTLASRASPMADDGVCSTSANRRHLSASNNAGAPDVHHLHPGRDSEQQQCARKVLLLENLAAVTAQPPPTRIPPTTRGRGMDAPQ
jgi:hypothetical protein